MGIPVLLIQPGSHADVAGIKPGDKINKIDDLVINDGIDYILAMKDRTVGTVKIEIERDGETMVVDMVTGPPSPSGVVN